jgi:hypothetical protein
MPIQHIHSTTMSTINEVIDIIEFVDEVVEPVVDFYNDLFEGAVEYQDSLNEATGGDRDYVDVIDSATDMMHCNP